MRKLLARLFKAIYRIIFRLKNGKRRRRNQPMARIIISAGHSLKDPGVVALGTTESREMILTRN
ncbi:MAG: cell wall hydrolase, partial [Moorea sp. SIO3C2]|nr:cell wall hydrolase [Moorena sp. SIO3C2]